jgi:hypothetical protein
VFIFLGGYLASLFVKFFIGSQAHLGANAFNNSYPILLVFGSEVLTFKVGLEGYHYDDDDNSNDNDDNNMRTRSSSSIIEFQAKLLRSIAN